MHPLFVYMQVYLSRCYGNERSGSARNGGELRTASVTALRRGWWPGRRETQYKHQR